MRDDDEDADDDEEIRFVDVLPQNLLAVEVFQCCQLTIVGMSSFVQGFSAQEIESACRQLQVPASERSRVFVDLVLMGNAAADYLNKKRPKS